MKIQNKTLSLGTRNVTGSILLGVSRIARATSTRRTSTEDFGRNDKAWCRQSALKFDRALICGSSVLTSNVYTRLSPCQQHFKLCSQCNISYNICMYEHTQHFQQVKTILLLCTNWTCNNHAIIHVN